MVVDQRGCMHAGKEGGGVERLASFPAPVNLPRPDQTARGGNGVHFDTGQLFKPRTHILSALRLGVYQQSRNVHCLLAGSLWMFKYCRQNPGFP